MSICEEHRGRKFKYIFHLSDIHIQNGERYRPANLQAFSLVENAMKNAISNKKADPEEVIIVVVGDLFHHNNKFGVGDISDAKRFLSIISSIATIVIIPGNHDMNLNNDEHDDLIADFMRTTGQNLPNVFYYPNSGVYVHGNINFIHLSLRDMNLPQAPIGDNINVALAHETIKGAKVGTDVSCGGGSSNPSVSRALNHGRFGKDLAGQYDYILLGHVHEMQFLAPNMAYCGSLIQHNTGESSKKGFLLWDLDEASADFIPIETDYGYVKINIKDDEIPQQLSLPKTTIKAVIEYKNCSSETLKTFGESFQKKSGVVPLFVDKTCYEKEPVKVSAKSPLVDHSELLKKRLSSMNLTSQQQEEILAIHKENWGNVHTRGSLNWRLLSLEWDLLSCYGVGNYINFGEISGITGIIAGNGSGKSSVVEIILMALFGKTSMGESLKDMRNKLAGSEGCSVRIRFQMASVYIIERKMDRSSGKATCTFFEETKEGLKNLTEHSITETNEKIKKLIGDQKDYLYTIICSQYDTHNFANMKATDRRDKLFELFSMEAFVQIEKDTNRKIRNIKEEVKVIEQALKNEPKIEKDLEETEQSLAKIKSRLDNAKANIEARQKEKENELKNNVITGLSGASLEQKIKELQEVVRGKEPPEEAEEDLYKMLREDAFEKPSGSPKEIAEDIHNLQKKLDDSLPPPNISFEEAENLQQEKVNLESSVVYSRRLISEQSPKLTPEKDLEETTRELAGIGSARETLSENELRELQDKAKRLEKKVLLKQQEVSSINAKKLPKETIQAYEKRLLALPSRLPLADYMQAIEMLRSEISSEKENSKVAKLTFEEACANCQSNKKVLTEKIVQKEKKLSELEKAQETQKLIEERNSIESALRGNHLAREFEDDKGELEETQKVLMAENKKRELIKKREKLSQMIYDLAIHGKLQEINQRLDSFRRYQGEVGKRERVEKELAKKEEELAKIKLSEENEVIMAKIQLAKTFKELSSKTKELASRARLATIEEDMRRLQEEAEGLFKERVEGESLKSALLVRRESFREMKVKKERLGDQLYLQNKYLICMDRVKGIPGDYLEAIIGYLQEYSNKILEQFTNLSLKLSKKDTDKYTKLNISVDHLSSDKKVINYSDLSQASGYQKFACGIAIRIALQIVLNSSLGDFLIIDEGFSSSDQTNRSLVQDFVRRLKDRFQFVFLVSHLEEFKDIIEMPITIENGGGKSLIRHGSSLGEIDKGIINKPNIARFSEEEVFEKADGEQVYCTLCKKYLKERSKLAHANTKGHKSKM